MKRWKLAMCLVSLLMLLAAGAGCALAAEVEVRDMVPPELVQRYSVYRLNGTVVSDEPITGIAAEIYDLRALKVERRCAVEIEVSRGVREYRLGNLEGSLAFDRLVPGEKLLNIYVTTQAEETLAWSSCFFVFGECKAPVSITSGCKLAVSRGTYGAITDKNIDSGWEFRSADDCVTVTLPKDVVPGALSLEWRAAPKHVNVVQLDEAGEVISETDETDTGMMVGYYELDERARKVEIRSAHAGAVLCELNVYEKDRISFAVQNWQPLPEKLDMLIVVAHKNDELLSLGGTMTDAVLNGKSVGVVYMTANNRLRYAEGLAGIWTAGVHTYPIFLTYVDEKLDSYSRTKAHWGDAALSELVEIIRKYRPDVIVTHDINGEFGHNQHKLTCALTREAVEIAADAAQETESAALYGVWDTPKLYIHLYPENRLDLPWYEPRAELGGLTVKDWIYVAFEKHWSQRQYPTYSIDEDGKKYDCTCFGLARSTVGPDVEKNSFFENLD